MNQQVELGQLLANTIGSVVQAQEKLDAYTMERKKLYEAEKEGSLALPPLWYVFNNVAVELEMSATVGEEGVPGKNGQREPALFCRTLDPSMVSLYGYSASSGLRVKVQMEPKGFLPIKSDSEHNTREDAE